MLLEQAVCAAGNAGDSGAGTAVERATRTQQAGLGKAVVGSGARSPRRMGRTTACAPCRTVRG
jgi:hypothetical protein